MSSEAIAKKFSIYSVNDKPHNRFADYMAKTLGFYIAPDGNSGYQDEYLSINLTTRGGTTVSVTRYSQKAVKEMKDYINDNGLRFLTPPEIYKRDCKNGRKGEFNYSKIFFDEIEEFIKVNKVTYKLYNEYIEE